MQGHFVVPGTVKNVEELKSKGRTFAYTVNVLGMGGIFQLEVPSAAAMRQYEAGQTGIFKGPMCIGWNGPRLDLEDFKKIDGGKLDDPSARFEMWGEVAGHDVREYRDDNGIVTSGTYAVLFDAIGGRFSLHRTTMKELEEYVQGESGEVSGRLYMHKNRLRLEPREFKKRSAKQASKTAAATAA